MPRRPLRYLIAGAFNTLVSYAVYAAAVAAGAPVPGASALALVFGVLVGYATHGRWVFGHAGPAAFVRFVAHWVVLYGAFVGVVAVLGRFGVGPYAGGALATALNVCVSYLVLRSWVFRPAADDRARSSFPGS